MANKINKLNSISDFFSLSLPILLLFQKETNHFRCSAKLALPLCRREISHAAALPKMAAACRVLSGSSRWPALARCCWRAEVAAYFSTPAASSREAQQREVSTRRRGRMSQLIRSHIPPRTERMAVDQDWSSVYPTAAAFKPASVPLPIRMGYPVKGGVPPPKEGNLELIKIPNFLHLTPPAIKKHCAALRDFCTEWPSALDGDEKCEQHFPVEIETVDYVSAGTSIRNPKARIVTLRVKLSNLNLDDHAKKKLIKLVGKRYCKDTDVLTIITDRCPLRRQNYDYGIHLLTVLYHESWKTEAWESEKTEEDMEEYIWENSSSQKNALDTLLQIKATENVSNVTKEELLASEVVRNYRNSVIALKNEGETESNMSQYKESVKKLLNIQALP